MSIADFALSYVKSPIILTGGIASNVPGGLLPIVSITQAKNYDRGILSGSDGLNLDDYLFDFFPMAGATLAENEIATYPFANQTVAANSIISNPLKISLMMLSPARGEGGWSRKLSVFQSLKTALQEHGASGGTYTVATPSYPYVNCILTSLRDISDGDPKQAQSRWQWDFVQPLLTLEAAQQAQNALMAKLSNGTQIKQDAQGHISYSGQGPAVGNPASGLGPSVVPAAQPLHGSGVSGRSPPNNPPGSQ